MSDISIRRRLTLMIIGLLVLTSLTSAIWGYQGASHEAEELFDAELAQLARFLQTQHLQAEDHPLLLVPGPHVIDEVFGHKYEKRIAFQIISKSGNILVSSAKSPVEPLQAEIGFSNFMLDDKNWRSFKIIAENGSQIITAQDEKIRQELASYIAQESLIPQLLMLPLAALFCWLAIGRGLAPLNALSQRVKSISSDSLQPIKDITVPQEARGLTDSLNDLLARLEITLQRERQFTADAAHELRTPLAALQLHTQLAQRQAVKSAANDQLNQSLDQVLQGTRRLTRLVEQLLMLSRLESQSSNAAGQSTLSLIPICQQQFSDLLPMADQKHLQLILNAPQTNAVPTYQINGHSEALAILIRNLLDNAIKYSPENGEVTLSLQQNDLTNQLQISVTDQGCGFSQQALTHATERFWRDIESSQSLTGSGLGLSLVKRIVELMDGSIQIENQQAGGAKVTVFLTGK
ncbi:hypothetical protein DC094_18145 [Pelagibaculum spongiae]|uniref:histidine kinase n=2 Tax=Pelagibaculum spongiae TaxID=2080658 RepID=A0A2V1GPS3_9GAMM|nr:hypothetical protein DC094_18145 [Pelagibaculum spongiae]